MKYTAIISTDEPLTEDIIQDLKDTMFLGDDPAYAFEIEEIKCNTKTAAAQEMSGLTDMTDKELIEHYYDMAHLPLTPETKEHDKAFFHDVVMEMAARFARTTQEVKEAAEGNE